MTFRDWNVIYTRRAQRDIRRIDRTVAIRIHTAVNRFTETGRGDVRRLSARENQRKRFTLFV